MSHTTTPAFLVVCGRMTGQAIDPEYARRATPPALEHGLTPIAGGEVGQRVEVLEGALPAGTSFLAIEQFPSMDALKAFYHSDDYQAAIPFRESAVSIDYIAAVDGIPAEELAARAEAAAKLA